MSYNYLEFFIIMASYLPIKFIQIVNVNGYEESRILSMSLSKFLQAPPNVLLFKYAPLRVSTLFLQLLGTLYYIVNLKERKLIEKNVLTVFKNPVEADIILKKTIEGIFSHYSEKLLMAYRDLDILEREIGGAIEYSGINYLDETLKMGGVLLITGHFGAVEFMPLAFSRRHYPVSSLLR